ncbi:MAG TPA: hypothetical protein PK230_12050 [Chitinophagales bacterium]|nr:hypothetical protein [Chitinophagales bacterium]
MGVSLRVGLYRASLRYGAALLSALANATLTIPNALRHSNKYTPNLLIPLPFIRLKNITYHQHQTNNQFTYRIFSPQKCDV